MDFVSVGPVSVQQTGKGNVLGGSALYSALGASLLADVGLVARIKQGFPAHRLKGLKSIQVLVEKEEDFKVPSSFAKPVSLHLGDHAPALQLQFLDQFNARKFVSADTTSKWISSQKDKLLNLLEQINVMFVNEQEARLLTGENDLKKAAMKIANGGFAVIKRGEKGVIVADSEVVELPAYPTKVVSDAGAGDVFAGAFMAYLSKRPSVVKAAAYGNVIASFFIEDWDPSRLLKIDRRDVNRRYKKYLKMF